MQRSPRIVFVGGGSGGHFYPLIAVAEALKQGTVPVSLYYMGPDPYDAEALKTHDITFIRCSAGKKRKYFSLLNFTDVFKTFWGICTALLSLYIVYPDVIISKGSFTSIPVVLSGAFLGIPIIVHESDTRPGSANKVAGVFARHIAISFPEVSPFFPEDKTVFTGIPMRTELLAPLSNNAVADIGIDPLLPTILVLGGSLGADRLNQLVLDSLDELLPHYNVIHQTGKIHYKTTTLGARELISDDTLLNRYRPIPFVADPRTFNDLYHLADIIVARSGSGTIYEIAAHQKPAILVPIPESVSHDQRSNAYAYAKTGAAVVLEEANLVDSLLSTEIERIMQNKALYEDMAQAATQFAPSNGAGKIAGLSLEIIATH